jgi:chromate transport protein ChrA
MDTESKFLKAVRLTNVLSIIFLIVELAVYINVYQRIAFFVALISYTIETILEKKWRMFRWENSPRQWFFIVAIIFFFLQLFFFPFEKNTDLFVTIIEERIPFLIF